MSFDILHQYLDPSIRPTGCETTGRKDTIWTPTGHLKNPIKPSFKFQTTPAFSEDQEGTWLFEEEGEGWEARQEEERLFRWTFVRGRPRKLLGKLLPDAAAARLLNGTWCPPPTRLPLNCTWPPPPPATANWAALSSCCCWRGGLLSRRRPSSITSAEKSFVVCVLGELAPAVTALLLSNCAWVLCCAVCAVCSAVLECTHPEVESSGAGDVSRRTCCTRVCHMPGQGEGDNWTWGSSKSISDLVYREWFDYREYSTSTGICKCFLSHLCDRDPVSGVQEVQKCVLCKCRPSLQTSKDPSKTWQSLQFIYLRWSPKSP